jgi:hypothetical protein
MRTKNIRKAANTEAEERGDSIAKKLKKKRRQRKEGRGNDRE